MKRRFIKTIINSSNNNNSNNHNYSSNKNKNNNYNKNKNNNNNNSRSLRAQNKGTGRHCGARRGSNPTGARTTAFRGGPEKVPAGDWHNTSRTPTAGQKKTTRRQQREPWTNVRSPAAATRSPRGEAPASPYQCGRP